jgi:hypothetical protein
MTQPPPVNALPDPMVAAITTTVVRHCRHQGYPHRPERCLFVDTGCERCDLLVTALLNAIGFAYEEMQRGSATT